MSDIEYELGNIADAFKKNTNKRIENEQLTGNDLVVFNLLQEELWKALRTLENAIISKYPFALDYIRGILLYFFSLLRSVSYAFLM